MARLFSGRVALVTGGGTGLGRAISLALAAEGAQVAILSRSVEHQLETRSVIEKQGGTCLTLACDVRDADQVQASVLTTVETLGVPQIIVNNAAGNFLAPLRNITPNGWKTVIDVVLNGAFFVTKYAVEALITEHKSGSILNIVATYAWTGGPNTGHSAAAKAGVIALTRTAAVEYAPYSIRVNALAPGPIMTEGATKALWNSDQARDFMSQQVPLGRFGTEREVADSAVFLLSDKSSYTTGAVLTMDGGRWLNKGLYLYESSNE